MKEHPILMNGPMVRATSEGRKTQTRRIVKVESTFGFDIPILSGDGLVFHDERGHKLKKMFRCPYGQPGDRLWVRETFFQWVYSDGEKGEAAYMDDPEIKGLLMDMEMLKKIEGSGNWKKVPSIHMPRAACRILLEITDIRVERLQAITEVDAIDESVLTLPMTWVFERFPDYETRYLAWERDGRTAKPPTGPAPSDRFRELWKQINGAESWNENPWVWVIGFKRIEP